MADGTHNINIEIIKNYFNISNEAATYIYFRRKRGSPWRKEDDPKYLVWSVGLLNALIKLDQTKEYDWNNMHFGKEVPILMTLDIPLDNKLSPIKKTRAMNTRKGAWALVTYKKIRTPQVIQDLAYTFVELDEYKLKYN